MIEEKLLYAQAELDSITVTDDQVEQQLEQQINFYISPILAAKKILRKYMVCQSIE